MYLRYWVWSTFLPRFETLMPDVLIQGGDGVGAVVVFDYDD